MMKFVPNLYFLSLFVLLTACDSSSDDTSDDPPQPPFKLESFDAVPVSKTNSTKIYMHYMPWFETRESSPDNQWGYHWTMQNKDPDKMDSSGKREIASHYYPLIGPYHSGDRDVIENHLLLMKYAGIDGVLIDWYGTYDLNDYKILRENSEELIAMLDEVGLEYAIVYEDRFLTNIVNAQLAPTVVRAAKNDLEYIQRNYFKDANYIKIDNSPLLLNFGPITLSTPAEWTEVFSAIDPKPTFLTLWHESSEAGANAQGEYSWVYENNTHLSNFYNNDLPKLQVGMGSAYPGFNDFYKEGGASTVIGWKIDHNNGTTLDETLALAKSSNLKYLQLITWNDFGEGTMFEPTREFGYTYIEKVKTFAAVQNTGNEFENIGELYNLRKKFKGNSAVQKKLDQVFQYFVSLQTDKANTLLQTL